MMEIRFRLFIAPKNIDVKSTSKALKTKLKIKLLPAKVSEKSQYTLPENIFDSKQFTYSCNSSSDELIV